ncbi:MAG: lysylphosphatidylglycerol synthase transmembrane domain-containing protein [Ardenticatenaceae bacterium]|nr:lysylphosphatidylglycerol synthase transmembrane domain-containing protein [Ardenticatenaceae bacterium]
MKKRFFLWLTALALLFWIWVQIPWPDVLQLLFNLSVEGLLLLILLNLAVVLTVSGRWWLILLGLRGYGQQISYLTLTGYRLAALGISFFTPGPQFGGEPLQVWVLSRYHNTSTSTAIASVTVDKLLELIVNFAVLAGGIVIVLQAAAVPGQTNRWTLIVAAGLWIGPLWLLWLLARGRTPFSSFLRRLFAFQLLQKLPTRYKAFTHELIQTTAASEAEVTRLYQYAPGALLLALLVTIANWIFWLLEFWFVYGLLGFQMSFTELMILVTAARIAFLLPFPGSVGTLEASQLLAVMAVDQPMTIGISATLIMRLRDFFVSGFGLWLSGRLMNRRSKIAGEGDKTPNIRN